MNPTRRNFLNKLAAGGALAAAAPFLIRNALAMGDRLYTQGFHKLEGSVLLNNKPAKQGDLVKPGDRVTTGANSRAIFVVERDAYLLRSDSQLEISGVGAVVSTIKLIAGKMLTVFGKGEKKIIVPTATLGVRGTAIYAEADPVRSYLCTCYGTVEIKSNSNPQVTETVVTRRHDMPRYIYASGENLIVKAPVINHTEDELYMLEALVGRLPEFHQPGGHQGGNAY